MGEVKPITTESIRVFAEREKLPCRLTEAERMEIGDEIARLNVEATELEMEAEDHKLESKAALHKAEPLREQIKSLAWTWRRGTIDREVEVQKEIDYRAGHVTFTRTDTGEVIRTRDILPSERQMSLGVGGGD